MRTNIKTSIQTGTAVLAAIDNNDFQPTYRGR
jgi:hypothetical protein